MLLCLMHVICKIMHNLAEANGKGGQKTISVKFVFCCCFCYCLLFIIMYCIALLLLYFFIFFRDYCNYLLTTRASAAHSLMRQLCPRGDGLQCLLCCMSHLKFPLPCQTVYRFFLNGHMGVSSQWACLHNGVWFLAALSVWQHVALAMTSSSSHSGIKTKY